MFPILETERLILREIIPQDAQNIYANFSNEQLIKYYGMNAMTQLAEYKH